MSKLTLDIYAQRARELERKLLNVEQALQQERQDLRRQLQASDLPDDQRAKLLKDLDEAMKGVSGTAKTAQ